jgi:flagellar biosynthesis component FlhA
MAKLLKIERRELDVQNVIDTALMGTEEAIINEIKARFDSFEQRLRTEFTLLAKSAVRDALREVRENSWRNRHYLNEEELASRYEVNLRRAKVRSTKKKA